MHEEIETEKRQIAWEKWRDPFGSDATEAEWPGAWGTFHTDEVIAATLNGGQLPDEDWDEMGEEEDAIEAAVEAHQEKREQRRKVNIGIMSTPMGIIPITEHTSAGSIFNFWTAHATFKMTQEVKDIIENTPGIESFDLNTPYRWRIAIGKAFSSTKVKKNVMTNLGATPLKM